jgi:ATPase family associated with various cellular activities (AAA)
MTFIGTAFIAAASSITTSIIASPIQNASIINLNKYYIFPDEFTNVIDDLFSDENHCEMGNAKYVSNRKKIPGEGYHYYYLHGKQSREFGNPGWGYHRWGYVGLEKCKKTVENRDVYYYSVWHPNTNPWHPNIEGGENAFKNFEKLLISNEENTIKVMSIDKSSYTPYINCVTKICESPKDNQNDAMKIIFEQFTAQNNYNVKVMLFGNRGVGKTYTAMLLKKHIDNNVPNTCTRLFDDFDPASSGMDVKNFILRHASLNSPVIIIINEIDSLYEEVYKDKVSHDPRSCHTKNKSSFTGMLDDFGSMKYVIVLYTTEKSPDQLYENENYKSFMRKGRIDKFIHMSKDKSEEYDMQY